MYQKDFAKIVDLKSIESHLPPCAPPQKKNFNNPHTTFKSLKSDSQFPQKKLLFACLKDL